MDFPGAHGVAIPNGQELEQQQQQQQQRLNIAIQLPETITVNSEEIPKWDSDNEDSSNPFEAFSSLGMVLVGEQCDEHSITKNRFLEPMGVQGTNNITVVAIHKYTDDCPSATRRAERFEVLRTAVSNKHGGRGANIQHGWYASSKKDLCKVISHGFTKTTLPHFTEFKADGIYLCPAERLLDSISDTIADGNGLRHVMLCRAILGNQEVIPVKFHRSGPRTPMYDSAVDQLENPTKYIVWGSNMGTHILPCYIISFTMTAQLKRVIERRCIRARCESELLRSVPHLVCELARVLSPIQMRVIQLKAEEFRQGRVYLEELVRVLTEVAGRPVMQQIGRRQFFLRWMLHVADIEESMVEGNVGNHGNAEAGLGNN